MKQEQKSKPMIMMVVAMLVTAVVCGGVGYKVGGKVSQAKRMVQFEQMRQQGGQGLRNGIGQEKVGGGIMQGQGHRHTEGEILSVDDKGVTVKLADGSSKIVLFSDKTTFITSETIDKSKIVVGGKVDIVGNANSDGSVNASELRIIQ